MSTDYVLVALLIKLSHLIFTALGYKLSYYAHFVVKERLGA